MVGRAIDDKSSDTLVVVSGEGFWTGSSTLPHLHHFFALSLLAGTAQPRPDTETPGHGRGRTWRR